MATKPSVEEKRLATLAVKTAEQKLALLEQLAKCCIIQLACERTGIGRSTYYMWLSEDKEFKDLANKAISVGRAYLNDIAFSGLLKRIQENNITMLIFWLKNNHPWFAEKIRHEHKHRIIGVGDGILTPEQREEIIGAYIRSGRMQASKIQIEGAKKFLAGVETSPSENSIEESKSSNTEEKLPASKKPEKSLNIQDFLSRQKQL